MELSEHLLPSYSVELSVSTLDQDAKPTIIRLKTIIESGYNNGFFKIISPMNHGRMYVLHDNEIITVTFYANEDNVKIAYQIPCKVIEKSNRNGQYTVTLKVQALPKKVQRREAFRVNVFNTYNIEYGGKKIEIVTKDISSTGMRALSPVQMKKDDTFAIQFDANVIDPEDFDAKPDPAKRFTINCRVIDSMPQNEIRKYMLRIQFLNLTAQQSKSLIQYLYAKQAEVIAYDTDLSAKRDKLEHLIKSGNDKRKGDDAVIKRYQAIGFLNFVIVFFAIMFLLFAQPEPLYSLDKFFNVRRAKYWNATYFSASLITTIVSLVFGGYGIILNGTRMKRKTDRFSIALIITLSVGFITFLTLIYLVTTQNIYNVIA